MLGQAVLNEQKFRICGALVLIGLGLDLIGYKHINGRVYIDIWLTTTRSAVVPAH